MLAIAIVCYFAAAVAALASGILLGGCDTESNLTPPADAGGAEGGPSAPDALQASRVPGPAIEGGDGGAP